MPRRIYQGLPWRCCSPALPTCRCPFCTPAVNIGLMMAAGFFVNGPYALITTAVSADLGTHQSLAGAPDH